MASRSSPLVGSSLHPWRTSLFECCETGSSNCIYACFCPLCAQGDIAFAAGKDYYTSCCVIPLLCPCYNPCHVACTDREALARKYSVHDEMKGLFACLVFSFMPFGHTLMLTQELNEISLGKPKIEGMRDGYGGPPMQTFNGQPMQQQQGFYPPPNGVAK